MSQPVLTIEGLDVAIGGQPVIDDLSLSVAPGEIVTLVGESGCGKSMAVFAVMGLLPPVARITRGSVRLDGEELVGCAPEKLRQLRGDRMAMIFQEPVASLNPLMPIGPQIAECLIVHRGATRRQARAGAIAMLDEVGMPEPALRYRAYPFELSGGMCQRAMIAMALVTRPRLLIADEPTTALDVTTQAQILELMQQLRAETGTAILFITHDMGVVADIADRVAVMYAGGIVEEAPVEAIFAHQEHPYTRALLSTIPRLDSGTRTLLPTIGGSVPDLGEWPQGCRFSDRCPLADAQCRLPPPLVPHGEQRRAACWHSDRMEAMA